MRLDLHNEPWGFQGPRRQIQATTECGMDLHSPCQCQIISTTIKHVGRHPVLSSLSLVLKDEPEPEEHAMTSNQTRRSFGGKPLKTKTHSRSSSSTTSLQIETPSDTSPSVSPSLDMPPRTNGAQAVHGLTEDMANTEINGSRKTRRGMPVDRKQSTPMMPAFIVSAPGKVIVFGEHAVVHGKVYQIVHSLLH